MACRRLNYLRAMHTRAGNATLFEYATVTVCHTSVACQKSNMHHRKLFVRTDVCRQQQAKVQVQLGKHGWRPDKHTTSKRLRHSRGRSLARIRSCKYTSELRCSVLTYVSKIVDTSLRAFTIQEGAAQKQPLRPPPQFGHYLPLQMTSAQLLRNVFRSKYSRLPPRP